MLARAHKKTKAAEPSTGPVGCRAASSVPDSYSIAVSKVSGGDRYPDGTHIQIKWAEGSRITHHHLTCERRDKDSF